MPNSALHLTLKRKVQNMNTTLDRDHLMRWLTAYHQAMAGVEGLQADELAAWAIVIEEELRALDYYQPVLGLPDTLKAKAFTPVREKLVAEIADQGRTLSFDFAAALEEFRAQGNKGWKSLRQDAADSSFPVLPKAVADGFRAQVRSELVALTRSTFPSLADTDKPEPASDWG